MVVNNNGLDRVKSATVDFFDDTFSHTAFGDDSTAESISDTTLGNELLRRAIEDVLKDKGEGEYIARLRIPLTQGTSGTIKEVAIFDSNTGGTMGQRDLTPVEYNKTNTEEVLIDTIVIVTPVNK